MWGSYWLAPWVFTHLVVEIGKDPTPGNEEKVTERLRNAAIFSFKASKTFYAVEDEEAKKAEAERKAKEAAEQAERQAALKGDPRS